MSAPKAENGFVGRRIVSSRRGRRNNSNKKASDFNDRRTAGAEKRGSSGLRNQCRSAAYVVSACGDHGGLGGVGLDLPADSHDSQIDGAITLNARRPDLHVKQQMRLRDLAAPCARVLQNHSPPKLRGRSAIPRGTQATLKRGRREDRVRAAPAVSRAKMHIARSAHEHTGSAEAVRPSLRNGFTAYIVLSPARPGLLVTVTRVMRSIITNLTPAIGASGPHDFAVRLTRRSSKAHQRPSLPAPTSVTMANAPSLGTG